MEDAVRHIVFQNVLLYVGSFVFDDPINPDIIGDINDTETINEQNNSTC